jgi:hypothetical protein
MLTDARWPHNDDDFTWTRRRKKALPFSKRREHPPAVKDLSGTTMKALICMLNIVAAIGFVIGAHLFAQGQQVRTSSLYYELLHIRAIDEAKLKSMTNASSYATSKDGSYDLRKQMEDTNGAGTIRFVGWIAAAVCLLNATLIWFVQPGQRPLVLPSSPIPDSPTPKP